MTIVSYSAVIEVWTIDDAHTQAAAKASQFFGDTPYFITELVVEPNFLANLKRKRNQQDAAPYRVSVWAQADDAPKEINVDPRQFRP